MQENDIVFFNLHRRYLNFSPEYGGFIGIYVLSAFLNHNGYDAQGYSGQLMEGKKILDELCQEKKVSMIGLYCDYDNVTENIFLSSYIKEKYGLPIIVGGPQATALKEDFYLKSKCDAVVRYEGELTVLELVQLFLDEDGQLESIAGISYWDNGIGKLKVNPDRPVIQELDKLPLVSAADYLKPELYYNRSLSLMTGRGCPFHCAFCHEGHHTRQVRFRSVENVLQEIRNYVEGFPGRQDFHLLFLDDTFTLKPERVRKLCAGLRDLAKEKNCHFEWFSEGHIHTLYMHPEMIDYMQEAGCVRLQLGIEAGTQEVLDAYRKGSTLEEIRQVIINCRDAGIREAYSNIIIGGAHFNRDVFERDKAFAKELLSLGQGVVELDAVTYWPLPETSITDHAADYGIKIIDGDFLMTAGDFPQIESGGMDRFTLCNWASEMHNELADYKSEMLKNGEVPLERIVTWLDRHHHNTSGWFEQLAKVPEVFATAQLLATGEAVQGKEFSDDVLLDMHPMRVISLVNHLKARADGSGEILGYELDAFTLDILIHAAGKLSTREIAQAMIGEGETDARDCAAFTQRVIDVLRQLEVKRLLLYFNF